MTWLPPSWEVRTKVNCDALTFVVGASKPTLEESFDARADIFISSDDSKPIVSQRNEPQPNPLRLPLWIAHINTGLRI